MNPRSSPFPVPGDVLGGKYRVERLLAVGGMGAVLAASHLELGQGVAIKVLLPTLLEKPEMEARFFREGRAVAMLRSEHVARVFDSGRFEDGAPFLVMELLVGLDLERLVQQRGPLPIDVAVGAILQACDALAEAHALGIVHRDIKPSNLFLAERPGALSAVKVLDFGISKSTTPFDSEVTALTTAESTLGSPQFMSPEQLKSAKDVDARTDIWSLGQVLYWMLTGGHPFEASSMGHLISLVLTEPPKPLRARRPDVPEALEAVVLRCLEKEPERRFPSVAALVAELAPMSPPWTLDLVASLLGRAAEATPPAVAPAVHRSSDALPAPGLATQAAWTPVATRASRSRSGVRLSLQVGAVAAALVAGIFVQRYLVTPERAPLAPRGVARAAAALSVAPPPEEPPRPGDAADPAPAASVREPAPGTAAAVPDRVPSPAPAGAPAALPRPAKPAKKLRGPMETDL